MTQCKPLMSFNESEQAHKEFKKKKWIFAWSIMCLNGWKHFYSIFLISFFTSASFFLIVFLFCQHFCLLSHFEIIRCFVKSLITTSMYYLIKYNWNRYTGLPNSLKTWLDERAEFYGISFKNPRMSLLELSSREDRR